MKSAKYNLFHPCKEMAYIPLDEDTKGKGKKTVIDVLCNLLGKPEETFGESNDWILGSRLNIDFVWTLINNKIKF